MVRADKTLLSARTSDFFHADGKMDSQIDEFKMFSNWTPITGKTAVTTLLDTSSTPLASVEKYATVLDTFYKVTCEKDNKGNISTPTSSPG